MRRTAALAKGKRSAEDMISHLEALALARSGRLQDARRTSSGRRRDRAERWSARAGGALRSWRPRCGKRSTGMPPRPGSGPPARSRTRQRPRRGLCRGVRAGAGRRCGSSPDACRRSREELSRGYVGAIPVSAGAAGPVRVERARSGRGDSIAADRLSLRPRQGRHRLHRTLRRALSDLRSRPGLPCGASARRRPPPSSSGFSIIAASCSSIPWTRWRACSWRERSRSRATP